MDVKFSENVVTMAITLVGINDINIFLATDALVKNKRKRKTIAEYIKAAAPSKATI